MIGNHYNYLNLHGNELREVLLENKASRPAPSSGATGRICFFNDGTNKRPTWSDGAAYHDIYPAWDGVDVDTGFLLVEDGVATAPSFVGDLTGNADTATALSDYITVTVGGKAGGATQFKTAGENATLTITGLAVVAGDITLPSGELLVGNGSNVAAGTAKSAISLTGFGVPTSDFSWGGKRIIDLLDPVSDQDAATKGWVEDYVSGRTPTTPCAYAMTEALPAYTTNGLAATVITITANGPLTVDGAVPDDGTRIFIGKETGADEKNNGAYTIVQGTADPGGSQTVLTRVADADSSGEIYTGMTYLITGGTANAGTSWSLQTSGTITLGTTALTFVQSGLRTSYTNGRGLHLSGGTSFGFGTADSDYTTNSVPYATGTTTIGFTGAASQYNVLVGGSGGTPGWGQVNLASSAAVSGILGAGYGGTGTDTPTAGSILYGNGVGWSKLAVGSLGNVIRSAGSVPQYGKVTLGPTTYTGTRPSTTSIHVDGILTPYNGGTGINIDVTPLTTNALLYASSSATYAFTSGGAVASLVQKNGSGVPTFISMSGDATIAVGGALTIANQAVTFAKMQSITSDRILGRTTSGPGTIEELTYSTVAGKLNSIIAGSITLSGAVSGSGTTNSTITTTLPSATGNSILALSGASAGNFTAMQAVTSGHSLRMSTGGTPVLGFGSIDLSNSNAVTNRLPTNRGGTDRNVALVFPTTAGLIPRMRVFTLSPGSASYSIAHGFGTANVAGWVKASSGEFISCLGSCDATYVTLNFNPSNSDTLTVILLGSDTEDPLS